MRTKWFRVLLRRRIQVALLLILQIAFLIWLLYGGVIQSRIVDVLLTVVSFAVALHVVSKRDKGAYKIAWLFIILLFPPAGGIFYLLCHVQRSTRRFRRDIETINDKTRQSFLLCGDKLGEFSQAHPQQETSVAYLQHYAGFPVFDRTKTRYLTPGEEFFPVLLEELEKAEHYIFFEYFIVQEGKMWNAILDVLKRKAAQGVKVRVMYDDMGCFFLLPKDYRKTLESYGIECAVFNPFRPLLTAMQNNRDHRKITSIDGRVAFTGGANLADEYINGYAKHGYWKDASVMLEGEAAWSFTVMFLQMWELARGVREDVSAYYPWKDAPCEVSSDGWVQPYGDSPMDEEHVSEHVYMQLFNRARNYIYINTPYLILDDSMLSALELAAKSGVDVRIVTPHVWDKYLVHMTTRSYYADLLRAGVRVYEFTPGFMHAKTVVCDDEAATVGTVNMDFRSLYLHFECGVRMYESAAVAQVRDDFLKTLEVCHEMTLPECEVGALRSVGRQILRLFAPLM